jgi:hypothetical protein
VSAVVVIVVMMVVMMMMMMMVMVMAMAVMLALRRCFFRRGRGRARGGWRHGSLRRSGDRRESDSGGHKHSHENFIHHFYLLRDSSNPR